jgi:hypothetical protein
MSKKPPKSAAAKEHKMTPRERAAMENDLARKARSAPRLRVRKGDGAAEVSIDHREQAIGIALLKEALGAADGDFLHGLIGQLVNAGKQGGEIDERGVNFMLSVIKEIKPRDQIEAMLAAQMAAVHMATMTFAWRLAGVANIQQQDSAERAFNKLARTFASQMETLKRYRTGGEQKVTVQHVTVSEGGQAIVGNVTQARRHSAEAESEAKSRPELTNSKAVPVPVLAKGLSTAPTKRRAGS